MKNLNEIAKLITEKEGNKKILNIGDVKEVLRIIDDCTNNKFYSWIKRRF